MKKSTDSKKLILITSIILFILGLILFIFGFVINWIFAVFAIPFYVIGILLIYLPFYKKVLRESGKEFLNEIKDEVSVGELQKQELVCANCKTENAADSKYCKECGSPLFKICPNCQTQIDINSKYCNHCGKEV